MTISPLVRLRGFTALAFLPVLTLAALSVQAEDPRPATVSRPSVVIRDSVSMFSKKAADDAELILAPITRRLRIPVTIEVIASLDGKPAEEVAVDRAKRAEQEGLYILLAKDEKKIEVITSNRYRDRLDVHLDQKIRDAFRTSLREGQPDRALLAGTFEIEKALAALEAKTNHDRELATAKAPAPAASDSSLVVRNQVRLTLAGARTMIAAAEKKAVEIGMKANIAVVDEGGHPLSFARMDGARPASAYTASTKAVSAATFRAPTGPLPSPNSTNGPDVLLNISVANAATAAGGRFTPLFGGIPVLVDGQVIGAIGVGGGSGEQDSTVAKAGVQALLDAIAPPHADTTAEALKKFEKAIEERDKSDKPEKTEDKPAAR